MNQRAYQKLLLRTGDASGIQACETRDLGLLFWRAHLTREEFHEALTWPENVTGSLLDRCQVHDRLQIPEPKDPTRKQYIVWGTDDCWNNHETASRGSENLLAITGSNSLIEPSYRTELPSGVIYWRVELRDDDIPKVQDLLEVRLVERPNWFSDYPGDEIGIPLPRRLRRPLRT
ncbi:hypothetical protein CGCTS75_v000470 [Colletotrichum tropicale]|nr:hypothetical protein CGCTS75_v000470 [Colletotrichum tropicale]